MMKVAVFREVVYQDALVMTALNLIKDTLGFNVFHCPFFAHYEHCKKFVHTKVIN
jgi:hypothetical protein